MLGSEADSRVLVDTKDFDIAELHGWLKANDGAHGALVTFTGMVRDLTDSAIERLYLEHYPGMTEKALHNIVAQACSRWSLGRVAVYHRVGALEAGDNIVFVGVSSAHRKEAFDAAQFLMDYLKRDAPFWKKEVSAEGENWVVQKESDMEAAERWG